MYDELIAELRQHHCDAKEDDTQEVCEECSYDVIIVDKSAPSGIASVCVCGLMNRAANVIEELSQIAAHYEQTAKDYWKEACDYEAAIPRWIPVTERLPEQFKPVFVYYNRNGYSGTGVAEYYHDGDTKVWRGCGFIPTHWMPLQEPPKEE